MIFKFSFRQSLMAVGMAGVIFLASLLFFAKEGRPSQAAQNNNKGVMAEPVQTITVLVQPTPGFPIRLRIPAIKVDAEIDYVGLTSSGAMDVPKSPATVAWYSLGPRPGDTGNAVMAGHYGWKNKTPAIFDNLHKIHIGDAVYVDDENGSLRMFTVRELKTYNLNQDAKDVFVANDNQAHLNLVTCQGIWNKTLQSYSSRLVVFTDAVAH